MKRSALALGLGLGLLGSYPALAQSLAAAERAYQEVDFQGTHDLARRALEAGGKTRIETARLYMLLGMSAAALGDAVESKRDYINALAIDPTTKLEKTVSPKIRDPYLEAQGYWSTTPERLVLSAQPGRDPNQLVIHLVDGAQLTAKVDVRAGKAGELPRSGIVLGVAEYMPVTLPEAVRGADYVYVVQALDRYGNVVSEVGNEADPVFVKAAERAAVSPASAPMTTKPSESSRSYVLPITLGVLGVGAVATGIVFNVKREQAADDWNGPSCERPGKTRLEQCSNVDSRIHDDEHLAVGFYIGGGALLAGSVIALIVGGRGHDERNAGRTACGFAGNGLTCAGRF